MASMVFCAFAAAASGVAIPVMLSFIARDRASEISGQRGCGPRGFAKAICAANTFMTGSLVNCVAATSLRDAI